MRVSKGLFSIFQLVFGCSLFVLCHGFGENAPILFPANGATNVNPDTPLSLTFQTQPKPGNSGFIRVYEANSNKLVDEIDMKLPPSPYPSGRLPGNETNFLGPAESNEDGKYQVNVIAGYDFHYFPVIVRFNTARLTLHNGRLDYGKRYIVRIDSGVITGVDFNGILEWSFETKRNEPLKTLERVTVSADGQADFNTVQGAIDWLPSKSTQTITIFIKEGQYDEIVFMTNKANVRIQGESRGKVILGYPNNSAFNQPKSGPSRRPAFSVYNSKDVYLKSFQIHNYFIGQAEALLLQGDRIILDEMSLIGSGDALTTNGTIYITNSFLKGDGDTVLGYGSVFWNQTEIQSIGPVTWTRTPAGVHGNVFLNCTIVGIDKPLPWTVTAANPSGQNSKPVFARLPNNHGLNYPNAEMVLLNTKTEGISVEGWGPIQSSGFDTKNVHFWEYNTTDLYGKPIDMSQRHHIVKQLKMPDDSKVITEYSKPEYVLGGWKPVVI